MKEQIEIPWLNTYEEIWRQLLNSERTPHAVLITGSRGIGKRSFASWMAGQHLGIENVKDKPYHPYVIPQHADLRWIQPEEGKRDISVDQIRSLIEGLSLSSYEGIGKVAVIEPFNMMNINSSNSLLKILEEPKGNTLILLIADKMHKIPATILSRCHIVKINSPRKSQSLSFLDQYMPTDDASIKNSHLMESPLLIDSQLDFINKIDEFDKTLTGILLNGDFPLDFASKLNKEEIDLVFDWMLFFIYKMIKNNYLNTSNTDSTSSNLSSILDSQNLFLFFDKINLIRSKPRGSFNFQLSLEELLIDWRSGLSDVTLSDAYFDKLPKSLS
jgi:DNA polymerase-3 subunit delta'